MADSNYIDDLVNKALDKQNLTPNQVIDELGEEVAKVASDIGEKSDWYIETAAHQGLGDVAKLARSFVLHQIEAIRNELCDPDTKSLKEKYEIILDYSETPQLLQVLTTAIISIIAPEYTLPSVVVPLALLLSRIQITKWCSSLTNDQILSELD